MFELNNEEKFKFQFSEIAVRILPDITFFNFIVRRNKVHWSWVFSKEARLIRSFVSFFLLNTAKTVQDRNLIDCFVWLIVWVYSIFICDWNFTHCLFSITDCPEGRWFLRHYGIHLIPLKSIQQVPWVSRRLWNLILSRKTETPFLQRKLDTIWVITYWNC